MKKPIIGIVGTAKGFDTEDPFLDQYMVVNTYVKRVYEEGGIPISLLCTDCEIIEEALDICDGILIPGGTKIREYHFKFIDYAIKHDIPLLGICMGMQSIAMHSVREQNPEERIIEKIETDINHWPKEITRETIEDLAHSINIIDKESILYNLFETDKIEVNSLHNYRITKVSDKFKITATSDDNTIEAIEIKDKNKFVMGVQWHPELLSFMSPLFQYYLDECKKRMK